MYGRLYNWNTARTACPSGWHLPTDAEWTTLVNYGLSLSINAGKKLKAKSFGGTDEYGFAALPGGILDGRFDNIGYSGYW